MLPDDVLIRLCQVLQVLGVQLGVVGHALGLLGAVDGVLEVLAVDPEHGLAEHLDEAAVRVPGEPLVARLLGQAVDRLVGQADVEDRLHHARHGELRPGPDADQERVGGIAELPAHGVFQVAEVAVDFPVKTVRRRAVLEVIATCIRGYGEAGRHRKAEIGHLGQVRALATKEILEVFVTFCEVIHELRH